MVKIPTIIFFFLFPTRHWKQQLQTDLKQSSKSGKPSLVKAIFRTFWRELVLLSTVTLFGEIILRIAQPILLGRLLLYFRWAVFVKTKYGDILNILEFCSFQTPKRHNLRGGPVLRDRHDRGQGGQRDPGQSVLGDCVPDGRPLADRRMQLDVPQGVTSFAERPQRHVARQGRQPDVERREPVRHSVVPAVLHVVRPDRNDHRAGAALARGRLGGAHWDGGNLCRDADSM